MRSARVGQIGHRTSKPDVDAGIHSDPCGRSVGAGGVRRGPQDHPGRWSDGRVGQWQGAAGSLLTLDEFVPDLFIQQSWRGVVSSVGPAASH